jgi:hypothetical protein
MNIGNTSGVGTGATTTKKEYELLPEGDYTVALEKFEEKQTKKKLEGLVDKGSYISTQFNILAGPHEGRKLFHNFNIQNMSPKAQSIAIEQLNKLVERAGIQGGFEGLDNDTDGLNKIVGQPVVVRVKVESGTNGYKDRNKISSFLKK